MDKNQCKICGSLLLGVIIASNYPVCKFCLADLREYPDLPVRQEMPYYISKVYNAISDTASVGPSNYFDL